MVYTTSSNFLHYLLLFLGSCFLLLGCQGEQATTSKTIYANYYIRHSEQERTVRAEASFQEGDSIHNKVSKQFTSVLFGGKEMSFNQMNPKRPFYLFDGESSGAAEISFRFIDDNGHQQEDIVSISGITSFTISNPIIPSKEAQLSWDGTPLGQQESIIMLFTDENNRTTSTIMNGPSQTTQLNIPAIKIKGLHPGKSRLYLVRKNRIASTPEEKTPTKRQVKTVTEFYTKTINVEVTE